MELIRRSRDLCQNLWQKLYKICCVIRQDPIYAVSTAHVSAGMIKTS